MYANPVKPGIGADGIPPPDAACEVSGRARRLTLSDVQMLTEHVARSRRNPRFGVPKTGLCGIEMEGRTPSIYRLYPLATVYDCDIRELLRFYGCG